MFLKEPLDGVRGGEFLQLILHLLPAQPHGLFQQRPLFFWNGCERLLGSAVGVHIHQSHITPKVGTMSIAAWRRI